MKIERNQLPEVLINQYFPKEEREKDRLLLIKYLTHYATFPNILPHELETLQDIINMLESADGGEAMLHYINNFLDDSNGVVELIHKKDSPLVQLAAHIFALICMRTQIAAKIIEDGEPPENWKPTEGHLRLLGITIYHIERIMKDDKTDHQKAARLGICLRLFLTKKGVYYWYELTYHFIRSQKEKAFGNAKESPEYRLAHWLGDDVMNMLLFGNVVAKYE